MIRNQREYDYTRERIADFRQQVAALRAKMSSDSLDAETIDLANAPTLALIQDLEFDLNLYDRLRHEGPSAVPEYSPEERGKALIALRIACGLNQKDLADLLGVSQALVSRDEKNDYHGIAQDRYARILNALGIEEVGVRYIFHQEARVREP
jgi:DNA-binding XRE family transcriptional regulator